MEKKSCQHNTRPFKQVDAFTVMLSSFDKEIFSLSRQPAAQNLLKTCLVFCSNPFSSSECENIFIVLNDGQVNDQAGVVTVYFLEKQ